MAVIGNLSTSNEFQIVGKNRERQMNGSDRYHYMVGIIDGLRALGSAAYPPQIYSWLKSQGLACERDLQTIQKDGGTRFTKEVRWARKELFDAGLIGRNASGEWTIEEGIPALTLEEARAIVRIRAKFRRTTPVEGLGSTDYSLENIPSAKPSKGPLPTDWSGVINRVATGPAATYLARFGERDVWKIGYAQDLDARAAELNRHVPHEVLGEQWRMVRFQRWSSAILAYRMEQVLLRDLDPMRTVGERVRCEERQIRRLWDRLVRSLV